MKLLPERGEGEQTEVSIPLENLDESAFLVLVLAPEARPEQKAVLHLRHDPQKAKWYLFNPYLRPEPGVMYDRGTIDFTDEDLRRGVTVGRGGIQVGDGEEIEGNPSVGLGLTSPFISRQHFRIQLEEEGRIVVTDLSRNGTRVSVEKEDLADAEQEAESRKFQKIEKEAPAFLTIPKGKILYLRLAGGIDFNLLCNEKGNLEIRGPSADLKGTQIVYLTFAGESIIIGRNPITEGESRIQVIMPLVSRDHVRVTLVAKGEGEVKIKIEDLDSTNGTEYKLG